MICVGQGETEGKDCCKIKCKCFVMATECEDKRKKEERVKVLKECPVQVRVKEEEKLIQELK